MSSRSPGENEHPMSSATIATIVNLYIGDKRLNNHTQDTINTDRVNLTRFARSLPSGEQTMMRDISPEDSKAYIIRLQTQGRRYEDHPNRPPIEGGLSPFTIHKNVRVLKAFGTWLSGRGMNDPFADLPRPKMPKKLVHVLEPDDVRTMLDGINPSTEQGARLYAIALLVLDSGLRVSEVASAMFDDLDLDRRVLKVMGKGRKERYVPFGDQTAHALLTYITMHRPAPVKENTLILSVDGHPLTRGSIEHIIGRLRRRIGAKRLHMHLLRHTFAVQFTMNGGAQKALQNILGHTSPVTTNQYQQLSQQMTATAYRAVQSPVDSIVQIPRRVGFRKKRAN